MAGEVVDKKDSINSSTYLSKEEEAERNEIFHSRQCLDFTDLFNQRTICIKLFSSVSYK